METDERVRWRRARMAGGADAGVRGDLGCRRVVVHGVGDGLPGLVVGLGGVGDVVVFGGLADDLAGSGICA